MMFPTIPLKLFIILGLLQCILAAPYTGEQYCKGIPSRHEFDGIRKHFRFPLQKIDGQFSLLLKTDGWWIKSPPASTGQVGVIMTAPTDIRYKDKTWIAEMQFKDGMGKGYFYLNNGEYCYINDIYNVNLIDTIRVYTVGE